MTAPPVRAVLFDRDGTLIQDVPYNGDPERVAVVDGAAAAVSAVRAAQLRIGLVTNQSGIGRGLVTREQVDAVNRRVEALLGRFDVVEVCPHVDADGCGCRKPAPGMVAAAAIALGVGTGECVLIGDIGADVEAARAAGARAVLVPTAATLAGEIADAEHVAPDLAGAIDLVQRGCV